MGFLPHRAGRSPKTAQRDETTSRNTVGDADCDDAPALMRAQRPRSYGGPESGSSDSPPRDGLRRSNFACSKKGGRSMTHTPNAPRKPKAWYQILYVQVLIGIAIAIVLGHFWPAVGIQMKPLGDTFIKLIKMIIAL